MMVPVGRLVILRTAPRAELVRALAWLTIPALVGPMIGPPLGGFIATYFHWRYIFWINVPIGALGVVADAAATSPICARPTWRRSISRGSLLSGLGLSVWCLVSPSSAADSRPALVDREPDPRRRRRDFRLCATCASGPARSSIWACSTFRPFFAAILGGFLFRIGIGAIPFLLPLLLQAGFHLTAFQSGSLTFVAAAGAMAMKFGGAADPARL